MASFSVSQQEEGGESNRLLVDDPSQRRQRLMVGAACLLACFFFVLDLLLPLGVASAVLYCAVVFLSAASQHLRVTVHARSDVDWL